MGFLLMAAAWLARIFGIAFADPAAEAAIAQEAISIAESPQAKQLASDIGMAVAANSGRLVKNEEATGPVEGVDPGLGHGGGSLMRGE